ncbi:MAG: glycosyltransferase family 2 protein, partial [Anaerolineae bacterium]|nr:glycosyltransferase family 2 protein [Anaerolineae bacterium]
VCLSGITADALLRAASGVGLPAGVLGSLRTFMFEQMVEEAVCIVQHPIWEPVVAWLRERYGWKLVVDGAACQRAAAADQGRLLAVATRLAEQSDLVCDLGSTGRVDSALCERIDRAFGLVAIIIVSYHGRGLLSQCVEAVLGRTVYPNYEIIIVDNGSGRDVTTYLAELERREPRVRVILNGSNRGFAAANNIGLQQARESQFVVLLNNDTVVPRGWLCRLLRHARRPDVGLVGPVTNWAYNEARIDVGYRGLEEMYDFCRAYTHRHEGEVFDIRSLAMYCVAMRRVVADQVGPLDERFGIGMFEDDDYSRRVRQAGYRVICARDVFVHHYGMASFARMGEAAYRRLFERNKRLYEEKWGGASGSG